MCRMTRNIWVRPVALALAALMVLPILCQLGASSASAQLATYRVPEVAVLDFVDNSGRSGGWGRVASDAIVLALDQTKRYDPMPRSRVEEAMTRLGLSIPMDLPAQVRLATDLDAYGVVTGKVGKFQLLNTRQGKVAQVELTVLVSSKDVSEIVNGARVMGQSTPKPGFSGDPAPLFNEALSQAAFNAAQQMSNYEAPTGAVIATGREEIVINLGSEKGVYEGQRFVVTRFGRKVAVVEATKVQTGYTVVKTVQETLGVSATDKVTAIYAPPSSGISRPKRREFSTMLGAAAVGAGILFALFGLGRHGTGAPRTVKPVVSSLANVATAFTSENTRGAIFLNWNKPSNVDVVGYEIWRDGIFNFFVFVNEPRYYLDTITAAPGVYTISLSLNTTSGAVTQSRSLGATSGSAIAPVVGDSTYAATGSVTRVTAGSSHFYQVLPVARIRRVVIPGQGSVFGFQRGSLTSAGSATAIPPAVLVTPGDSEAGVPLGAVDFSFNSTAGASHYVLQVSRTRSFASGVVTFDLASVGSPPPRNLITTTRDLTSSFPLLPGTTSENLFWRIGARNDADLANANTVAPRPFNLTPPQDFGFVWSQVRTFQAVP